MINIYRLSRIWAKFFGTKKVPRSKKTIHNIGIPIISRNHYIILKPQNYQASEVLISM